VPSTIPSRAVLPVAEELAAAVEILAAAENPIILMGDGVSVSGAQTELAAVAERLAAPVWGVDDSELNMDSTHPLYRGQLGHMFGDSSAGVVQDADAILVVGTYLFPEVFPRLASPFRPDARIVHIDLDDYEIAKNFPVDVALVADPKPTLAALAEALGDHQREPYVRRQRPAVGTEDPLIDQFAAALAKRCGPDLIVFDEALTASPGLVRQLPPTRPGSYFLTRGGSLGIGIPGAIGAKLARPTAEVVGFTGDGGSMYTFQALWTAARYDVAAKFVICDNQRYQLLAQNIDAYWRDRDIPAHGYPSGFDLAAPALGFVELARGLGVAGVRVEKPAEIDDAVEEMLAHQGPFLVDLVTA
jgi:benzoylformate decarboxylase